MSNWFEVRLLGRLVFTLTLGVCMLYGPGESQAQLSPIQLSMQYEAKGALLASAAETERSLAMYRKAWTAYPQDHIILAMLEVPTGTNPPGDHINFLQQVRTQLTNQAVIKAIDNYLAAILPSFQMRYAGLRVFVYPPSARVVAMHDEKTNRIARGAPLWVKPGSITVEAVSSGYQVTRQTVDLRAGTVEDIRLGLNPIGPAGSLAVDSKPAGARIYINGVDLGNAPVLGLSLPEGDYVVTGVLPGHETIRGAARVTNQGNSKVTLTLTGIKAAKTTQKQAGVATAAYLIDDTDTSDGHRVRFAPVGSTPHVVRHSASGGNAMRTGGWLIMGTGVILLAGGGGLTFLANKFITEANAIDIIDPQSEAEYDDLAAQSGTYQKYSFVAYGVGAAATIGGLLMVVLSPNSPSPAHFQLSPIPGGAILTTGGEF